ncbi:MAG: radical SAM protein [Elusimicrobia bacterium]|nr:radical SAM protein [Elusimicrobiota bacterium]
MDKKPTKETKVIREAAGITLNRYGTFLGTIKNISAEFAGKLAGCFERELAKAPTDKERKETVDALHRDLSQSQVSSNIQEESLTSRFFLTKQEVDWMGRRQDSLWMDYLVYRYQFKIYPKTRKLRAFPLHLLIEPTSVCNLRCVMCFQVDASFTKKEFMGFIPWELFANVVDQAKEHNCHAITMASRGEPTMAKPFGKMLRYCGEAGIMDIKINTNATKLTEELCHDIFSAGVSEVVFSVDAGTKQSYEEIRVLGKFDEVLANIERFNEIRARYYPKAPTITRISGVLVRDDQDVDQMTNFWSKLVDQVTIKRATPRWDSYNNAPTHVGNPCGFLWERTYVWYDGKVNPCDFDYKSYLCVGDALKTPISEIWRGESYEKLRQDHLDKRRAGRVPCDRCPIY